MSFTIGCRSNAMNYFRMLFRLIDFAQIGTFGCTEWGEFPLSGEIMVKRAASTLYDRGHTTPMAPESRLIG